MGLLLFLVKVNEITVLVKASIAVMKHHDQKQLGEERAYFTYSSLAKAVRTGTQEEQEPGSRS